MVDFDMVHDHYSNKVPLWVPDLLHSLVELGCLCLQKERRAYKGLFYANFLVLCEIERGKKKGFS